MNNALYLVFLTLGLYVAYSILLFFAPTFFGVARARSARVSPSSITLIIAASIVAYAVSFSIADPWWSDRVLHVLGGGAVGIFVCFRAVKDSGLRLSTFQFFVFSVLVVTALGVGNELVELFLQTYFNVISSTTPTDTWFDLTSNTIGIILGTACFIPLDRSGA